MDQGERLRRACAEREKAWPAPIEWHPQLSSTSDRLKDLARGGAAEWTTVLAERQSGGRGREGRSWVSPPGGLYLSVLLRPRFAAVGLVPLAAGVAVAEATAIHGVVVELKWPNDVIAGGRKLGGILSEASSGPSGVEWIVVGIGVNVLAGEDELGKQLRDEATSMVLQGGAPPPLWSLAADVLASLSDWYDAVQARPRAVVDAWRARAVPWWGQVAEVRTAAETFRGRLRDVDDEGALIVDLALGGSRRVVSGELVRLRRAGAGGR